MQIIPSINVLDIPLFSEGIEQSLKISLEEYANDELHNHCISATGAHGMIHARKDSQFKNTLQNFYMNMPDGMPGVWVGRLKGAKNMERCYGPEFFKRMIKDSADKTNVRHFLCGGMEGVAEKLKTVCESEFGNQNIVGTYCPPFKHVEEFDYAGIAEIIKKSRANFVWIGLSTPKQERFAELLSKHTNVKFIACVGAAFDFHIGSVRQAPKVIQKMGLEWLFRLIMEPKRLWKRYIEIVPSFIYYNFAELLTGIFKKRG